MTAPKIQCSYDDLYHIATDFQHSAQDIAALKAQVSEVLDTLRSGDWRGTGAEAFFREMESEVLPAVQRLRSVLETAGSVSAQIARTFADAEREAGALFQGDSLLYGGAFALGSAGIGTRAFNVTPVGYSSTADPEVLRGQIAATDAALDALVFSQSLLSSFGFSSDGLDAQIAGLRESIEARRAGLALTLIDQIHGTDPAEWSSLSSTERADVLKKVHEAMAKAYEFNTVPVSSSNFSELGAMGQDVKGVFHFGGKPKEVDGQMVSIDHSGSPSGDFILYSEKFVHDSEPRGVEYIVHESRHVFQNRAAWNPQNDAYDYVPPDLAKAWKDNFQHYLPGDHADYKTQAVETDAYAIQDLFRKQLYGK